MDVLRLHNALFFGKQLRLPSQSVLSDFRKKLKPKGFRALFDALVKQLGLNSLIVALDSSNFKAYANKFRKVKSDKNAGWLRRKSKAIFSYKLHVIIDAEREVPIVFCITSANVNCGEKFGQIFPNYYKHRGGFLIPVIPLSGQC
ncbi:hypothetical protein HY995_04265 [Candidatus Micrarchaeota archaeon]|nr:hypothetical protein [Candidatus Micrarchaeota archaeon]